MYKLKKLRTTILIYIIVFVLVFIFFILHNAKYFREKIKFSKSTIAKIYGVEKRTFSKWLDCFVANAPNNIKTRRKLNLNEIIIISKELGNPFTFPSLSRGDLIEIMDISYKELRVIIRFDQKGYDGKFKMKDLIVLPPLVAKIILKRNMDSKELVKSYLKKEKKLPLFFNY